MRQSPARRHDGGDAAAGRFHPSHSDPQEVLPAIPRFACEVRRFDPAAFQVLLESCRHVQYSAYYADEVWVSIATGGRRELITVSFGSESAKSCLRAFVPHNHHPMFLFLTPTIFCLPGVETFVFITPYASLCRQRRSRTRTGRQFWRWATSAVMGGGNRR